MRFSSINLLLLSQLPIVLGNLNAMNTFVEVLELSTMDKRGIFSTVGSTTTTKPTPASPTSVNESSLPSCGITCFDAMLAQASALGCATADPACLCENVDFSNGLRDCSNGVCGTVVASTVIAFGSAYCASATFGVTPTAKPVASTTSLDEASLPSCGQTCFNAMLAQASELGCATVDPACLCENVDFSNGLRDCSNGVCGTDVASTVIAFGNAYYFSATATTAVITSSSTKSSSVSTSSSSTPGSSTTLSTSKSSTLTSTSVSSHSVTSTNATHTGPVTYDLEMTTTFIVPPECTLNSFTQTIEYQDIWENMINPVPSSTYTSCFPSQFYSSVLAVASGIPLPPSSALICPDSWETYDFNTTYIVCCPKNFGLFAPNATDLVRPGGDAFCTSTVFQNVNIDITSFDASEIATTYSTAPPEGTIVFANAFDGIVATVSASTSSNASSISSTSFGGSITSTVLTLTSKTTSSASKSS